MGCYPTLFHFAFLSAYLIEAGRGLAPSWSSFKTWNARASSAMGYEPHAPAHDKAPPHFSGTSGADGHVIMISIARHSCLRLPGGAPASDTTFYHPITCLHATPWRPHDRLQCLLEEPAVKVPGSARKKGEAVARFPLKVIEFCRSFRSGTSRPDAPR